MMALAAVFPAAALSMPMLVGRKKREEPRREDNIHLPLGLSDNDDEDAFVKHFTTENERELKQKDIAAANCRRMVYDRRSDATPEEPATSKDHVDWSGRIDAQFEQWKESIKIGCAIRIDHESHGSSCCQHAHTHGGSLSRIGMQRHELPNVMIGNV
jgi:hypothetical protein